MDNVHKKETFKQTLMRILTSQSNKTPYENWKEGKRVFKAPYIIEYYRNITDFNQYLQARKIQKISILIDIPIFIGCGIWLGYLLWG